MLMLEIVLVSRFRDRLEFEGALLVERDEDIIASPVVSLVLIVGGPLVVQYNPTINEERQRRVRSADFENHPS